MERFRGIERLDWTVDAGVICLVGPGDSTKTSILDALGAVLSPRYNLLFTDADFYACDTAKPIVVTAVVVDLPKKLIEERAHGKNRSGIRNDGALEHDPLDEDGVDECLIVRLTVDQSLEPVWEVVRPGDESGDRITAGERAQLGFFRVGEQSDAHLRWGRTSALTGVTASRTDAKHAVVEAQRRARAAIAELDDTPLHEAAQIAKTEAVKLGSAPFTDLRPGLDPRAGSGVSSLVLHEGSVPLTSYGLGSRRLTSLAIQDAALEGRSIVAIDEIEHGLEPHRLLHLIRYLRKRVTKGELQIVMTTHAALAVEALHRDELFVVRSVSGTTTVRSVPSDFEPDQQDTVQGLMRERPSALLARRVIVGEGATETGFLRQALFEWDARRPEPDALTAVTAGVTVSNGSGDAQAPKRAAVLASLGYPTLLVIDNDTELDEQQLQRAVDAGVEIVRWPEGQALEDAICRSLPVEGLQALVELAAEDLSEESVVGSVKARLPALELNGLDVEAWVKQAGEETTVREAIAAAAKARKQDGTKSNSRAWFKREDRAERLASAVFEHRNAMGGTPLAEGLTAVREFAYADVPKPEALVAEKAVGEPAESDGR